MLTKADEEKIRNIVRRAIIIALLPLIKDLKFRVRNSQIKKLERATAS